jgi:hypothetical protein
VIVDQRQWGWAVLALNLAHPMLSGLLMKLNIRYLAFQALEGKRPVALPPNPI